MSITEPKPQTHSVTIPAGEYIVGDPCYCFSHSEPTWGEFCSLMEFDRQNSPVEYVVAPSNGRWMVAAGTKWGDGLYFDQHGHEYDHGH